MPEGDTIWRAAGRMHTLLAGRVVTRFAASGAAVAAAARRYGIVGGTITSVQARGKHLLVHFAARRTAVLHTHMGMTGSWHVYRPGSRWRQPQHHARAVIETPDVVAVCFTPHTLEWLDGQGAAHLEGLGPDVVAPAFAAAEAVRRLRGLGATPVAAALLDQRALSGIGNIYKSESLFVCGIDPFRPVSALDEATLERLVEAARRLMRRNLGAVSRSTTGGGTRYWVYRRAGRPCRRCGAAIRMRRHGRPPRSTYWCPACQGEGAA